MITNLNLPNDTLYCIQIHKDGRIRVAVTDDLFCCIATKRSTLTCLDKTEDIGCWLGKSIGVYVSLLCLLISIFCSKGMGQDLRLRHWAAVEIS